ncbi:MAG TPA: hypothetical protein VMV48_02565 [Gallionellaceae bacterium]|nr:hypothetical protein [Gallionellaceae bacterium]
MATIDIEELRKEIDAEEKSLNEKKAVLRYLESKSGKPPNPIKSSAPAISGGVIQIDQLIVPETGRRTLVDDVDDITKRFGSQEFTVVHVDVVMQQQGIKDKSGEFFPRSRISTALSKLEDDGLIVRTFKGAGNVPHRFKRKDDDHDLA